MEQEIHFTDSKFDFSQISISQPISVQGGAYFTKIKCNTVPLYIQLPKCFTKQGLNETNKKAYIDLMFTNDDHEVVEWFEHLEEILVNLIYEKRELWFQNEMDKEDIENFFNPVCRSFKGGKFHLVRFNVPKNKTMSSQYHCNVYDENENVISIQELNETHAIIPCLEVQGIKFSARNFQLELVGKQIMLLSSKPLFNSCIIKRTSETTNSNVTNHATSNDIDKSKLVSSNDIINEHVQNVPKEAVIETKLEEDVIDTTEPSVNSSINSGILDSNLDENTSINNSIKGLQASIINALEESTSIHEEDEQSEQPEQPEPSIRKVIGLEDITNNLDITNDKSNINLKKPNEVYYEIYKIAKEKAKQHKKASMTHYLEAKKIKNTYLLDSLDDSDQSTDFESDTDTDSVKNEVNEIVEELM